MREAENPSHPSHLGGTVVALLLAPVVFVVFGGIVGAFYALIQTVFTDSSQWWIMTTVGIAQAIGGTYGAKAACDAVLRSYSGRAVFVEFALVTAALVAATFYLTPFSGRHVSVLVEFAFLMYFAWLAFWKGEEI